jgi:hypothetical protein
LLDPKAALIYIVGYAEGVLLNAMSLEYAEPVTTTPVIFSEFQNISWLSDTNIKPQSQITLEINETNPHGFRNSYWTGIYKLDYGLAMDTSDTFIENTLPIENVSGLVPAYVF